MRKRVYIALAVLLVTLAGVMAWQGLREREREPVYQGKRLSVWLRDSSSTGELILVRVQAETNNPRPCTDASHSLSVRGQPRQAHFQGPHYPGHV